MLAKHPIRGALAASSDRSATFGAGARIARWVQPQRILLDVDACNREQLLKAAAAAITQEGLPSVVVYDALWRREQAGSTALTQGFAIPHARVPGIAQPSTTYLRTATPIDFLAADGIPVSSFLVILVPTDGANDDHLQLLSIVAKLFSDRRFRKSIASASNAVTAADAFRTGIERVTAR